MAYWSLAFEFHRAILSLIEQKFYGAAFPLLKLFVEGTRDCLGSAGFSVGLRFGFGAGRLISPYCLMGVLGGNANSFQLPLRFGRISPISAAALMGTVLAGVIMTLGSQLDTPFGLMRGSICFGREGFFCAGSGSVTPSITPSITSWITYIICCA